MKRSQDEIFMALALKQAQLAYEVNEVPVGAVVVSMSGEVIGQGYNQTISRHDPTAHAEIVALREAAKCLNNYRLSKLSLYVTLEPCPMCMGAILQTRVGRLIYACADPKTGACGGLINLSGNHQLNHHCVVSHGVLKQASSQLLKTFFKERRSNAR